MTSRVQVATEKLKLNMENQLERLVQQLADIEESKEELEADEYEEIKAETMEQLQEFNDSLSRMISGDITLVDDFGAMQLATQAAISAAFHTPEVIRMFARKEPGQLREKMSQIERDAKLGKLSSEACIRQKLEVLSTLQQLGDKLSTLELKYLEENSMNLKDAAKQFVKVSDNMGTGKKALAMAESEARAMKNT